MNKNEFLKPLKRRSKQHKRAQRAGVAESLVEMLVAKWTAEGMVKGRMA